MGFKDKEGKKKVSQPPNTADDDSSSDNQSNETLPIPAMQELSLEEKPQRLAGQAADHKIEEFSFLKSKMIRKRHQTGGGNRQRLKHKIEKMESRIKQLQKQIEDFKSKENACPHCHFYQNSNSLLLERQMMTPEPVVEDYLDRSSSRDSLQFEKIDFRTPLMCNPELEEKSWVFLGTVMIAMGSKVMDMDGTINVFKIVKESVDRIRRQVEKSEQKLSIDFFLGKEEMMTESKMDELCFDPFYKQEARGGLQLQGVRVQSVNEYELYFDQKLNFNVKYDALITAMQYLKQNSNILYT